jgi:hypothetical protein
MKKMQKLSGLSFKPLAKTYMGATGPTLRAGATRHNSFFNMAECVCANLHLATSAKVSIVTLSDQNVA